MILGVFGIKVEVFLLQASLELEAYVPSCLSHHLLYRVKVMEDVRVKEDSDEGLTWMYEDRHHHY